MKIHHILIIVVVAGLAYLAGVKFPSVGKTALATVGM